MFLPLVRRETDEHSSIRKVGGYMQILVGLIRVFFNPINMVVGAVVISITVYVLKIIAKHQNDEGGVSK